jgi:hypothetical protein
MADYPTKQFFGTAQTVYNATTDITAGNFTGAPTEFNNTNDGAVPYATHAVAVLATGVFSSAPVAGTVVELWGVIKNSDGTSDDTDAPSGADSNGARHFGSFVMDNVTTDQRRSITISLEGVTACDFYLKNGTAQTLTGSSGSIVLKIIPFSYGVTVA